MMLLTVSAIAAIVHFPWVYTSQQNVNDMVEQLNSELMRGTENEVKNLFEDILASKQLIRSSLDDELIQLDEPVSQGRFYLNMLQAHANFTWVQFAFANGDYLGVQRRPDGRYNLIQRQWDSNLGEVGDPGSALAERQTARESRAERAAVTGEWNAGFEAAEKTVTTYDFYPTDRRWEKVEETVRPEAYYAPIRPFYQAALGNPGQNVWTDLYVFKTGRAVGLDAATTYQPLGDETIRGVISISFELQQISQYLKDLKDSGDGAVFIVDPEGFLVASSNPEALADTFVGESVRADVDLMPIAEVDDPVLQVAHKSIIANEIALDEIIGLQKTSFYDPETQQRYYVALKSLNLDSSGQLQWVVGTVMPESEFLQRINTSKQRLLIAIALFLGLGAVAVVWLSDRAITKPITVISDAAEAIESGNFTLISLDKTAKRHDELGKLSRVFKTMAKEVYAREQKLKQQLQALKIEIDESRKSREVREIVETDFFKDLKTKAQNLRNRKEQKRNSEISYKE
ncbi:HAMP domain-containing protein [Oscillatoria sp. CS-180]|uniref:sensor histidine kinase n=1 Tax=Oscillatoria sp. CS-180 TaxID=3021720 RepID=UPI00232A877E|nr:HAMP domain-containing protein [Oscillatoria sp. CS-180]MDB9529290.1 HAMP domain-containing protein [Oscillatoria sp. CS-180]